jgi:hypothetical protein
MATIVSTKRVGNGLLEGGYKSFVRQLDFLVDLSKDATMTTATDDISLAFLPGGTQVISASAQQVAVGTGTGTLGVRVGATAVSGTLLATDPVGTVATTLPTVVPLIVPLAGAELNLIGAVATRLTGIVRVVVLVVEGDRNPRIPVATLRDVG